MRSVAFTVGADLVDIYGELSIAGRAVTPPYPHTWIEFPGTGAKDRVGFSLYTVERNEKDKIVAPNARWAILGKGFHSMRNTCVPLFECTAALDTEGRPIGKIGCRPLSIYRQFLASREAAGDPVSDDEFDGMAELSTHAFRAALYSMAMLHCKNVEKAPVKKKLGVRARLIKRTRPARAQVKFHTLEVRVPGSKGRKNGAKGKDKNGVASWHMCRGHFSDHTEKGLFGDPKLKGVYWVPSHAKGSRKKGVVEKDYKLKE
jgi:hypothetical protein